MKTIIIGSGEIYDYSFCLDMVKSADRIICADGGIRHAVNMRLTPNVIIGDMDSSENQYIEYFRKKGIEVIEYPKEKDKTDIHICIEYALPFSREIVLIGATGSRIDHMLGNISLLKLGTDNNIRISIADNNNLIYLIKDSIVLDGKKNDFFSLIPFTEKVEGIYTQGAHYELHDAEMEHGSTLGISNYFEQERVKISIKRGYLLVIKASD
jgi:thiamine pyrophosphokinase